MIEAIFETLGEIVTAFVEVLANVFSNIVTLFWNATSGQLTILGILLLISVGTGLVYYGYRVIRGLIRSVSK